MARISVLEVTKLGWDLSWRLNTALNKIIGGALEDEGKVYPVHFSLNITLKFEEVWTFYSSQEWLTQCWSPECASTTKEDTWRHALKLWCLCHISVSCILNLFQKKKKPRRKSNLSPLLYCILHVLYFTGFYKRRSLCCSGNLGLHQNEINWSQSEHKVGVCWLWGSLVFSFHATSSMVNR